jgi:hypothetical protein
MLRNLVDLCVSSMMIIGFVAAPVEAGEANVIKSNASGKNICSKLGIVAGIIAILIISSNPSAFAETVTVKGSAQGTALTANFSFDGVTPASSIISTGKDNIGGTFNAQDVSEYAFSATSCTAPDGTAGTAFVLVEGKEVRTYKKGQLYTSGTAAADNSGCQSNTTGSFGLTETHSVIGGTGEFANASGSITQTVTGTGLAAPGSPPGKLGSFFGFKYTMSGSVNF